MVAKNVIKTVLPLLSDILLDVNISYLMHSIKKKIIMQLKKLVKKNGFAKRLALSQVMPKRNQNSCTRYAKKKKSSMQKEKC